MMKINKQRIWTLVAGTALVAVSFSLGYAVGSKSQRSPVETANRLIADDIGHAFGSVKSSAHESEMQEPVVMGLSGLVAGLEKKVAANPENIDQQLLLAQTYNELNNRAQSLKLLHALNKKAPGNAQIKITLATILMTGADKQELKEAYQMFDEAIKLKPDVASMARMYQGEIRVKLDNLNKQ